MISSKIAITLESGMLTEVDVEPEQLAEIVDGLNQIIGI